MNKTDDEEINLTSEEVVAMILEHARFLGNK
jgi:hypothetical protein